MIITIIDVSDAVTIKTYKVIEVAFKDEQGKMASKKLMSFASPEVFKAIQEFGKGDVVDVLTVKEGDYWQWKSVTKASGAKAEAPAAAGAKATPYKATASTYETPEERAKKQVYIVRQSSISAAVNLLSLGGKPVPTTATVIATAKEFEAYVFNVDKVEVDVQDLSDIEDDIPY